MRLSVALRGPVVAALLLVTTGCSLAVRGPGPTTFRHDGTPAEPDCMSSPAVPLLDVVAGVAVTALGVSLAHCESGTDGGFGDCLGAQTVGPALIVAGLVQGGIGLNGFSKTSACQSAKEEHARRGDAPRPTYLPAPAPSVER